MADLWMFVGALAVAYLVPGPDMLLILQVGARQGRTPALAVALGLGLARSIHVALAALGLAALLRAAPVAFEILRIAGAAYLVWLGVAILRNPSAAPTPAGRTNVGSRRAALRRGLLTNLLNPKALLFCSVLLPQFLRTDAGMAGQVLTLGALLVGIGGAFDLLYALGGAALGRWVSRHRAVETVQRWTFGALLIGFGLRLAWVQRL